MSVVIPFLICGACLILRLREIGFRRSATKQQQQEKRREIQIPSATTTTFNEEPITSTKVSQGGTPQLSRKPRNPSSNHEGVYYTNEPLDMYTRN